jgi:hypothetical protein
MNKDLKLALIIGVGFVIGGIIQAFVQPMIAKKQIKDVITETEE